MSRHREFDRLRPIRRLSYEAPSLKFAPDLGLSQSATRIDRLSAP
jgi:hypothetical protein